MKPLREISVLIPDLEDPDPRVRLQACDELQRHGPAASHAAEAVLPLLEDDSFLTHHFEADYVSGRSELRSHVALQAINALLAIAPGEYADRIAAAVARLEGALIWQEEYGGRTYLHWASYDLRELGSAVANALSQIAANRAHPLRDRARELAQRIDHTR